MYLIGALVAFFIGLSCSTDISDIPLSELTLRLIFGSLASLLFYGLATYLAVMSLGNDMVWPWKWRWNRYYIGSIVARTLLAGLGVWAAVWYVLSASPNMSSWKEISIAVFMLIYVLWVFFSDELDPINEPKAAKE